MHKISYSLLILIVLLTSCESIKNPFAGRSHSTQSHAKPAVDKGSAVQVKAPPGKRTTSQAPPINAPATWKRETIDTTAGAEYLTAKERQVILEINMVRTDPAEYAEQYLAPLLPYYRKALLEYPGEIPIRTHEGVRALEESIRELRSAKAVPALSPRKGLTLAARDHAKDQAISGATGHTGSNGSSIEARINRYGKWGISAGENIDYGNDEARRIVTALLIDDGVSSRGHRKNLLNDSFKVVGVSMGSHPVYRHMCVMDFAGSYR